MWWQGLTVFQQVLFILGILSGGVLLTSIVLTFLGIGPSLVLGGGSDTDESCTHCNGCAFCAFALKLVSAHSISAFIATFSWAAFTLLFFWPEWGAVLAVVAAGIGVSCIMAAALLSMQNSEKNEESSFDDKVAEDEPIETKFEDKTVSSS